MTEAEYQTMLESCDFASPSQVSQLVTSTHTNVMFNDKVAEVQLANPLGAQNFFSGFFGTETWPDGQGMDYINEYATDPYIPFTFSHFQQQSLICDPNNANECDITLCEVPEGGRGTMPPFKFFKWGFKTPRSCIANIRHIRKYQYWAAKIIRNRQLIDEQVMNMFYVMAALETTGHKLVMQGERDAQGNLQLIASTNPRNASGLGLYNYMQEKFPVITNINDLCPVTMDFLENLARRWAMFPEGREVGMGPRKEKIYEIWHPDDFYQQEVLLNPDYMKSLKYTMPNSQFAGYSLMPGDAEIIGNWKFRTMPWLPRFAPTVDGKIIAVQSHVEEEIEVGTEPLPNPDFLTAPIGLSIIASRRQGVILNRPTLTQSGDGIPILPISSVEPWQINNEYDKDCNEFRNKPFSFKRYELGFRMDDPNAAMAMLFRRRVYARRPIADCDLAPIFLVTDTDIACPITTNVGCNGGRFRHDNDITQNDNGPQRIECSSASCGNDAGPTYLYQIKVKRKVNQPDFNSLGCECGSAVTLYIHDDEGVFDRQIQGVLKEKAMGFPYGVYFIETTAALADGECIKFIACSDETPLFANVISAWDANTTGYEDMGTGVYVILDGPMGCGKVGDDVKVRYYNDSGLVVGTVNTTLAAVDLNLNKFKLTAAANLKADPASAFANATSMGVSCNEAPNTSSSSSGAP